MASTATPAPLLLLTNTATGSGGGSAGSSATGLSEATSRLRRNLGYFHVNYAAVVAVSLGASLLAHPFSQLALLGVYVFRAPDQPVVLFGSTFTDRETLFGLVVASMLAFFLTSVASVIFVTGTLGLPKHGDGSATGRKANRTGLHSTRRRRD